MHEKYKRLLFMEIDEDGRPFNVIVESISGCACWLNFEYSKRFETNYFYESGSGPNEGMTVSQWLRGNEPVLVRFWAAEDYEVTIEATLYERLSECPFTMEQLFSINYNPEDGEETFADCGDLEYCSVCDDWHPDFEPGDCPHLQWDRWWGTWIGTGTNEIEISGYRKAVFAVLKVLGPSRAKYLRRMLLEHDYSIYWSSSDLVFRRNGQKPAHLYCQGFRDIETDEHELIDRGLNWLDTLEAGKTDKEDLATVGWISEWLADKPSRRKPLPDGFTIHRKAYDEFELKYLGYPAGVYRSVDVMDEMVQKAQEMANERYPCLHANEALEKYMNALINYREHKDVKV